jgi:ribosomal protein S18 acetylase RimI-like enzyme
MIRLATENDLNQILGITKLAVYIMNSEGNFQWDETYPNETKFRQDISKNQLWVYEIEEMIENEISPKVVGFCAITTDQDKEYADCGWDINITAIVPHRLAVHPDCRGLGVAKKLMLKAEDIARERNIRIMRVDTNKVNTVMQGIFLKLGYTYCGEITLPAKREGLRFNCYEKILE